MPGESSAAALSAARQLQEHGIRAALTYLGENVTDASEAARATDQYIELLDKIRADSLDTELSVKLTQLGLDLSSAQCYGRLRRIIENTKGQGTLWIDMESSPYVDITLELYRRARSVYPNVGVCLQAYLHRTERDIAALKPLGPAIRLVKGAYREPANIAFSRKQEISRNFLALSRILLSEPSRRAGVQTAVATHDPELIRSVEQIAASQSADKGEFEFQMLYGIQRSELVMLARCGHRTRVLIAYGAHWFPWFMRRMAERPANIWLVARNLFRA